MHEAIFLQQIATVRHTWAVSLMLEFTVYARMGWTPEMNGAAVEFVMWSNERAEYARRAMDEMGITEEDQVYA